MGADVSRVRFDPLRDFSAVVLQQGRLLLDADFNELVALLDRRLRAETVDLTSTGPDPDHAGEAWVPRQTPTAFRVDASGGALTIGRGRMYVDGLVAENHGVGDEAFDPLLAEATGTQDTPYDQQPHWPSPDPLPAGGPHLAYLDVWQREVTPLEDPGLVEVAVGVDTTARLQTVWQVRLLEDIGSATCASDDDQIPGWLDLIEPSAGRLTTATIDVPPTDDPCTLPPTGGYRGLENQTYRVEVHDGGAPGTATFKWSRDNGSVAIPIVDKVSTTVLVLATVGKDDVLRVSTGDWVEILDDGYELSGRPGAMRKVTVDDAERTITLADALPADLVPASAADAAARHLRARRWDQAGVVRDATGVQLVDLDAVGATGVVDVPSSSATQVVLESGVVVSFSLAASGSGVFRPGDHWIFAARTADTSIEILDAAAPLGIHHHYARLGTVTFPDSETDCRRLWPPAAEGDHGCDCSVCVTPDSHSTGTLTIQAAVDQVRAGGGTVCLAAGLYELDKPIDAGLSHSLRIRGQGVATLLVARGTALVAAGSIDLRLEDMAIVSGAGAAEAILVRESVGLDLHDLAVVSYSDGNGAGAGVALGGPTLIASVRRNVIVAPVAVDAGGGEKAGVLGAALRIEENVLGGFDRAVDLGTRSAYMYACRVERNEVLAGPGGGIVATGAVLPGGTLDVSANTVATSGPGIVVGPEAVVEGNAVNALTSRALGTDGIVVAGGDLTLAPGHVRISGNRVHDRSGTGISVRAATQSLRIDGNVIGDAGAGIVVERDGAAEHAAIAGNEVLDVGASGDAGPDPIGICVLHCDAATVAGNRVVRVGTALGEAPVRAGIAVLACGDVRVTQNVVSDVGPPGGFVGIAFGIVVFGPFASASVVDNSSRFFAQDDGPQQGDWIALAVEAVTQAVEVGQKIAAVPFQNGAVVFGGTSAYVAAPGAERAGISSNVLAGGGRLAACFAAIRGDLLADGNHCALGQGERPIAIELTARAMSVATNRASGPKAQIVLHVDPKRFAAVGNITGGGTLLENASLPSPWLPLNVVAP